MLPALGVWRRPRGLAVAESRSGFKIRIASDAASNRNRPQRTPALHRLRTRTCPSSIEAIIKIKNAIKKIMWPISLWFSERSRHRARCRSKRPDHRTSSVSARGSHGPAGASLRPNRRNEAAGKVTSATLSDKLCRAPVASGLRRSSPGVGPEVAYRARRVMCPQRNNQV
jgi:hypothetical protein